MNEAQVPARILCGGYLTTELAEPRPGSQIVIAR